MNARAHQFGSHHGLIGIHTEPVNELRRPAAPTVLFANVGVHHRVGPYRLYVDLAQRLASSGFPALRFDLSGLGDSEPRDEPRDELARAVADLRDAMDFLQQRGTERFVVVGFCSGTDPAHVVARDDARVAGAVFLDGYAYRTARYYLHRAPRYARLATWRAGIERRMSRYLGNARAAESVYTRDYPSRADCESDLVGMVAKKKRLLCLFTGGAQMAFNHRGQLNEMFPRLRGAAGVEEEFRRESDHLFSTIADRSWLIETVASWASRNF